MERGKELKRMQNMEKHADIQRLEQMERKFDALRAAVQSGKIDHAARENAQELEAYYTGGQWLADYERDERGEFPADLKRGVLSQDGLYDLLSQLDGSVDR